MFIGVLQTYAQFPNGTIPLDCPDVSPATFQFDLNRELIALISKDVVFSEIENLFIHTYDKDEGIFDKLDLHYSEIVEQKGWVSYAEDDNIRVSILTNSDTEVESVEGIFVIAKSRFVVHLVNLVGKIPQHQIGTLLANLNILGIWIPELRSLGKPIDSPTIQSKPKVLETGNKLLDKYSPTILRIIDDSQQSFSKLSGSMEETHFGEWTYNALPIQRIEINSHTRSRETTQKDRIDAVKNELFGEINPQEGPEDFAVKLDRLVESDAAAYIEKITIDTDKQWIKIYLEEIPNEEGLIKLSKQFQTSDSDTIHEIHVKGIQNIESHRIRSTLEDGPTEIETAVKSLSDTIPEFDNAEVEIEEFGQLRIATITVQENLIPNASYTTLNPRFGFNRVTGWELGARTETGFRQKQNTKTSLYDNGWYSDSPITKDNSKLYAQFGYGFGNDRLYYRIGGNKIWGEREKWKLGLTAQFQQAISTLNRDLYTGYDNSGTIFL